MGSEEKNETQATGKTPDPNELTGRQKGWAGILLIIFTLLPAFFIISLWPDRVPVPGDHIKPLYHAKLLHMRLAEIAETATMHMPAVIKGDTLKKDTLKNDTAQKDTAAVVAADTGKAATAAKPEKAVIQNSCCADAEDENDLWHINTILLLLVALAGFLGNMIHIATSFTNFVGAKKFERSWILWYCVKPFTAASLAVGLYFVFRAGFLNMSNDAGNINLYGIMTISLLAGLFTDRATQKLKEIFEVLFKPKEERPNPMVGKPKIADVSPKELQKDKENIIKLKGENLDNKKLTATINDEAVTITDIMKDSATIKYSVPAAQKDKALFDLVVKDEEGNTIGRFTLKPATATPPPAAGAAAAPDDADNDNDAAGNEPVIKE